MNNRGVDDNAAASPASSASASASATSSASASASDDRGFDDRGRGMDDRAADDNEAASPASGRLPRVLALRLARARRLPQRESYGLSDHYGTCHARATGHQRLPSGVGPWAVGDDPWRGA